MQSDSPKSSPLSESAFPTISSVYSTHFEDQYPVADSQTNASLSVSPQEAKCFFPEQPTTQDYTVPVSTDATSRYYEARNFYASSAYPSTSYNSMFTGQSVESPLMASGAMYANSCVSPGYISSYPTAAGKSYTTAAASNGMGYGFGVSPTPDMSQYQAQTAAYQLMASRGSYPGYIATGATATTPVVPPLNPPLNNQASHQNTLLHDLSKFYYSEIVLF